MNKASTFFLFHSPSFVFRNLENPIIPFESELATIYFSRVGNSLVSLEKAPFGSFILDARASKSDLILLIEKIQEWSKSNQITHLTVRSYPEIYAPDQSNLIKSALEESGFSIKYRDITQVIPVAAGEEMNLNTHKKRRLKKAHTLGFTFRQINPNFLEESYALIVESRKNKGYPITMNLKELEDMFTLFPQDYLLFGVFENNKMIGTSVSIKINPQILYCFYLGDHLSYRAYSPTTFLVHGIHDICKIHKIEFIDLGISTDRGLLNKGLYTFKKTFGSFDSYKLTFEKHL